MADTTEALFKRIRARYNGLQDKISPIRLVHWTKDGLITAMAACGFTEGAEIGVREGIGAEKLCKAMPNLHLLCIDPWAVWLGHADMKRHADNPALFLDEAKQRLRDYNCAFIQGKSQDVAENVPDGSLDFVYIDGDHTFDGTMLDLILWTPKVKPGGIIAGHEYKFYRYNGVIPAVNAYTANHRIYEWYITNERDASYFWKVG